MEHVFRCEFCAEPISTVDYMALHGNPAYREDNAYIVHQSCDDPDGDEILQVVKTCGELKLVLVDEE